MIPGTNLLRQAQTLIRPTTVTYFQFMGRTTNTIGQDVSSYAPGVAISANVQAVKRAFYQRMGLDYTKRYIEIWTTTDTVDLYRDRAGDQIEWEGRRYELMNEEEWTPIDGWNSALAVDVGAATP